jgi:hypothetical protein
MSQLETANQQYRQVSDRQMSSADVFFALAHAGVLPDSFRVIKGTATLDAASTGAGVPILDEFDGAQITLASGDQVVYASVVATTALSPATATDTVEIGLALTTAATVSTVIIKQNLNSALNAGGLAMLSDPTDVSTAAEPGVVEVGANSFLVAEPAGSAITTGAIQVVLVVV